MNNVFELIEKFRKSDIYQDVLWQKFRIRKLKPILTEKLPEMNEEEFRTLLKDKENFMPPAGGWDARLRQVMAQNDFNEIKSRLISLFCGKDSIEYRLQAVMGLNGFGPFITSQLLSAIDDQFIIYHGRLVENMKKLLPRFGANIEIRLVRDAKEYLRFNEICKIIRDAFCFNSLGELHEFFWHYE